MYNNNDDDDDDDIYKELDLMREEELRQRNAFFVKSEVIYSIIVIVVCSVFVGAVALITLY